MKSPKTPVNHAREARRLKAALKELVLASYSMLEALDAEMRRPSTVERSRRVALLSNYLEFETDRANHFGMGTPMVQLKRKPVRVPAVNIFRHMETLRATLAQGRNSAG